MAFHEAKAFLDLRTGYPDFKIPYSILPLWGCLGTRFLDLILAVFPCKRLVSLYYSNSYLVPVCYFSVRPTASSDARAAFSPVREVLLDAAVPAVGP